MKCELAVTLIKFSKVCLFKKFLERYRSCSYVNDAQIIKYGLPEKDLTYVYLIVFEIFSTRRVINDKIAPSATQRGNNIEALRYSLYRQDIPACKISPA